MEQPFPKSKIEISFRKINKGDWPIISEIYSQGLQTGMATLETEIPTWEDWDNNHLKSCRLVAILDNSIIGYAVLSAVSLRTVYEGVAEVTIYISQDHRRMKIGSMLFERLILTSEKYGFWTLQSAVFPENEPSIRLHESHGFYKVGIRRKLGRRKGIFYDIFLMERRSLKVGISDS